MVFVLVICSRHSVALIVWIRFFFYCRKFSVISLTFSSLHFLLCSSAGQCFLSWIDPCLIFTFIFCDFLCSEFRRFFPLSFFGWFFWRVIYECSCFFIFLQFFLFVCLFYVVILSLVSEYVKKIFKRYLVFPQLPSLLHWSVFVFVFAVIPEFSLYAWWFLVFHSCFRKKNWVSGLSLRPPTLFLDCFPYLVFFFFFWVGFLATTLSGQESRE